jgi:hypothetical protein
MCCIMTFFILILSSTEPFVKFGKRDKLSHHRWQLPVNVTRIFATEGKLVWVFLTFCLVCGARTLPQMCQGEIGYRVFSFSSVSFSNHSRLPLAYILLGTLLDALNIRIQCYLCHIRRRASSLLRLTKGMGFNSRLGHDIFILESIHHLVEWLQ